MEEKIRAFVAIELSDAVKTALADLIELIRGANVNGVRTSRPNGIHLTLNFLGDISSNQIKPISTAISVITRAHSAFTLAMGGPGAFPNQTSARVLWMGLEGELKKLSHLQQHLEEAFEALGFARDRRRFNPHLTLARIGDRASKVDRLKVTEKLFSAGPSPKPLIEVDSVCLMRSVLLPEGAVYERLAAVPLGAGPSP